MTAPPRLAPLEAEELDALLARVCLPTFTEREQEIARRAAREAQRLARARARREALEEAIAVVNAEHLQAPDRCEEDRAYDMAVRHCVEALEALRDREEA